MPLNSFGRYTWTRSQLRTHRPSRVRDTLTIVAFWIAVGVVYAVLIDRVTRGGN